MPVGGAGRAAAAKATAVAGLAEGAVAIQRMTEMTAFMMMGLTLWNLVLGVWMPVDQCW